MNSVWRNMPADEKIAAIIAARATTTGSATEIAKQLASTLGCDVSRNAVIGIYQRNAAALTDYPLRGIGGGGSARVIMRQERLGIRKAKVAAETPKPIEPVAAPAPAPGRPSLPAIMPFNKPLLDLEARECRWPSDGFGPITFCAHRTHGSSSYCLQHYKKSLGPGMKTERNALRNLSRAMA